MTCPHRFEDLLSPSNGQAQLTLEHENTPLVKTLSFNLSEQCFSPGNHIYIADFLFKRAFSARKRTTSEATDELAAVTVGALATPLDFSATSSRLAARCGFISSSADLRCLPDRAGTTPEERTAEALWARTLPLPRDRPTCGTSEGDLRMGLWQA
eukprot:CAMPEP_0194513830 /NCGR_PEP_ID=MMETSP0253-20130528/46137_1 /TAXON_ID=2966 /ORGANISM="Noctiluca scintillans" /LENGTH=154 /DNA_ID=CAMNT_0039357413 /DNA_START=512 /DNA_END=973 /DNA_ORIENTATION=+